MIGNDFLEGLAMRTAKILGAVVSGLIVLFLLALAAVWLFVNPNDYKPKIAAAVKQATGRELVLSGDLKLSVFPWVALEMGPASLGNPPGFPAQPFVSFKHASMRVRLLPLLAKRLDIGRVELDGLDLKLLKNAEGKGNWEDFGHSEDAASPAPSSSAASDEALDDIAGVKLTHARVSYETLTLSNITLETGAFVERGVVPVSLSLEASRGIKDERASVDAKFDLSADLTPKRFRVAALNLNSVVALAGNPRPVRWNITVPSLLADLGAQTMSAPAFALDLAGALVNGSVEGTQIVDALRVTGHVSLAPLVVREYLPRMGFPLPKTRDPKALSLVSLTGEFAYGGGAARVDQLQVTLDDTHLKGGAAVALESDAIAFNLDVDTIDLDRYRTPEGEPEPEPATPAAAAPASVAADASKPLDVNGTLSVGTLHVAPLDLSAVKVTVATKDRVMHIFPLKAQVDGGQYSGDITLDNRTPVPVLSLDEHLSGIDIAKLLASPTKVARVSGKGNVNIKATGHGVGTDTLLKTLAGHFDTDIANGAVEGVDMGFELARAEALLRQQTAPNLQNTKRTKFDVFKLTAEIVNGVATTQDLTIDSPVIKITGEGNVNLLAKTLDMSLVADTLRTAGNVPVQVPVKVTGSLSDPRVAPDVEALAKGALKQKVQDVLQDKLKGLFGKP
jgi:AsmA protein